MADDRMLDSDRKQHIVHARFLMGVLLVQLDTLLRTLGEKQAGYPRGGEGSGSSTKKGEPPDQTASAALNYDPARADMRRIDRLVRQIDAVAGELDGIREEWLKTTTDKPTGEGDPGCEVVAKKGRYEAVFRTTDFDGVLPRKYRLGRWAYEFIRNNGRLPKSHELEDHLQGKRVRAKAS